VAEVAADRLMIGTDYPYPWDVDVRHLDSPHLSALRRRRSSAAPPRRRSALRRL